MIASFDLLLNETANAFGVETEDILGPRRTQTVSLARHVVMALWADYHPYHEASQKCNRGCHSTSMWARQRVLNMAAMDDSFAAMVSGIAQKCQYAPTETEPGEPVEKIVKHFSI